MVIILNINLYLLAAALCASRGSEFHKEERNKKITENHPKTLKIRYILTIPGPNYVDPHGVSQK